MARPCPIKSRQANRAEVDQGHAEAPAVHAERGIARGHAQVAPQRELQASGDGRTLDGRDHRLRQLHARRSHGSVAILAVRLPLTGRPGFQIGARAEGPARAGQDRNAVRGLGLEPAERLGKGLAGWLVDRVADLRSFDRHNGNGATHRIAHQGWGRHRRLLSRSLEGWADRILSVAARMPSNWQRLGGHAASV